MVRNHSRSSQRPFSSSAAQRSPIKTGLSTEFLCLAVVAVMELHTSHSYAGRQVYNWIEKMAKLREEDDRVNPNKQHLQNTIKHMSRQHLCAVKVQRMYKRKLAVREAAAAGESQCRNRLGISAAWHLVSQYR
jgi:hypothetical protein